MTEQRKYLAIIPARGGSKRLPRKNVLPLAAKPLIVWSIETALASGAIDKVVVSSDDDEILQVSSAYPVEIVKRPESLATDTATSFDAIKHVIGLYPKYEYTVLLQPTSPLRTAAHIDEAIKLLEAKQANAVISVCETEHSPLWSNILPEDASMNAFLRDEVLNMRSQDLPAYYRLNGAIYICKTAELLKQNNFLLKENIYAYVMDQKSSVDIDTMMDFRWAEFLVSEE